MDDDHRLAQDSDRAERAIDVFEFEPVSKLWLSWRR
jgi:hypothetical protein